MVLAAPEGVELEVLADQASNLLLPSYLVRSHRVPLLAAIHCTPPFPFLPAVPNFSTKKAYAAAVSLR